MITFTIPNKFLDVLDNRTLQDISNRIFHTTTYIISNIDRSQGRYITAQDSRSREIHYICFSNPDNNSRNARLMQFFTPTYKAFLSDTSRNKHCDIYILNPTSNDKTNYSKLFYNCLKTLGIDIINEDALHLSDLSVFSSYEDFRQFRLKNTSKNRGNKSTFFSDDDTQISLYGKTFGANSMESFMFALVLRQLVQDKPIVFYPVIDNDSKDLANEQREILTSLGIRYGETINELNNTDIVLEDIEPDRNTPKFHYNLLKKYGEKRCLLCGCDMEHLIIGSHIERVADIKSNPLYSKEEKRNKIVDANNGFWLCANHDKMFEFGIIYFIENMLKYNRSLSDEHVAFINCSLGLPPDARDNFKKIEEHLFNTSMSQYFEKHRHRIGV